MVQLFVLALLTIHNKVLLLRRSSTASFGAGLYSMVGGKVEHGEQSLHAIRREVREEVALDIPEEMFELVHVFHRQGTDGTLIALCFKADITSFPTPQNNEPTKHDDIQFFDIQQLPDDILPAHKKAIECIIKNISYSEHGW